MARGLVAVGAVKDLLAHGHRIAVQHGANGLGGVHVVVGQRDQRDLLPRPLERRQIGIRPFLRPAPRLSLGADHLEGAVAVLVPLGFRLLDHPLVAQGEAELVLVRSFGPGVVRGDELLDCVGADVIIHSPVVQFGGDFSQQLRFLWGEDVGFAGVDLAADLGEVAKDVLAVPPLDDQGDAGL